MFRHFCASMSPFSANGPTVLCLHLLVLQLLLLGTNQQAAKVKLFQWWRPQSSINSHMSDVCSVYVHPLFPTLRLSAERRTTNSALL